MTRAAGSPAVLVSTLALLGIALASGGAWLLMLGGSPYYMVAGLSHLWIAALAARRRPAAQRLYALYVAATLIWAVAEVGFDPWGLLPRISLPATLGLWFALPRTARALGICGRERLLSPVIFGLPVLILIGSFVATHPRLASPMTMAVRGTERGWQWQSFGGNAAGQRFAPLDQINRNNIAQLREAWTFRTGHSDSKDAPATSFQATPLQIDDQIVFCTPFNVVISVDGDSGRERWRFDPAIDRSSPVTFACRGVAYHADKSSPSCAQRILTSTLDSRLMALDAGTGRLCEDFGHNGSVDLTDGLGNALPGYHTVTSPPTIVNDVAVVGSFILDNQSTDEPSGVVRGYDVRTGDLLWAWDVLQPKAHPPLGPGETYPRNTPNVWSVASADPKLGLVYLPTGGAPPDFYGAQRTSAQERYGSSIVALDVRTGDVRWSFQTVHHDVWDYDVASQPVLFEFPSGPGSVPALVAPTKRGELFVLDRATGKPLITVREQNVPASGAPGELLAGTQPFVSDFPSLLAPRLRESMMWGVTPFDQLGCRIAFRKARYDGPFTPPTLAGTIVHTGQLGGVNWGSVSVDPDRQLLIANFNWLPFLVRLMPRAAADALKLHPMGTTPGPRVLIEGSNMVFAQAGTPYAGSIGPFGSPLGIPCTQPPWGQIAAIDLRARQVRWLRPFGTTRDMAPMGIALPLGMPNMGGTIVTRGGLVFVGAAVDNYIRAYDSETGAEAWRRQLPAGGQATPMTYISPKSGRQYVVIAAGGHSSLGTKQGDYLIAYSLPESVRGAN